MPDRIRVVASVSLSVRVERAWAPEAALGQVNEKRFTADLVVVKDDLTARRWCDSREHAELIASRPSFYFLLSSPNETRDQATAALLRLLDLIDAAIQRHGC